ncbi:Uncharacterised protein [Staphylococcus microti]|uniref:Uncharacterized protein n=1 Tax=Staphylococcus microti TaxID=569857 RepID=A0A380GSE3_9STAP|nr:Uncharacterised protein [Staphylococcus microti]
MLVATHFVFYKKRYFHVLLQFSENKSIINLYTCFIHYKTKGLRNEKSSYIGVV